jgi:uncharacterized tellurite resistance protein B-like protein
MVIHSTFSDFALFLYIHMAHADGYYHPSEQDVILEKLPKLFPSESNPSGKLSAAIQEYKKLSPDDLPTLIQESFRHFNEVKFTQRYKIYTDMYDIINADGKVDESETRALNALKSIIDAGSHSHSA